MPCYHPIRMKQLERTNKNGARPIVSYTHRDKGRSIDLPCGRCVGCRLERSRQWAVRCCNEMSMWRRNIFVTFTYRDEELIHGGAEHGILVPRHLTLFWKRLRKYGAKFRYFACGEYGDQSSRPHYHAIIFGYDFQDKKYHSTKGGTVYYYSDVLNRLWGHGDCIIGDATFESASYVARYVMKKRLGKTKETYAQEGISPEFVVMSRRPGIGSDWYDRYESDIFPRDSIAVRGHDSVPPKYYTQRFSKSHPLDIEDVKEKRLERAEKNWEENEPRRLRIRERVKRRSIAEMSRKSI